MLTKIREGFMGWKAIVVLVVLAASFVFFGVNMTFTGGAYFARVNGEDISPFEVQELYQAQASQYLQQFGQLTPELDQIIEQNVVQQLITNKVIETHMDAERIVVTAQAVKDAIMEEPSFQIDGQFSNEQYRSQLALSGRVPAQFERDLAQSLRFQQFQSAVTGSAFVTPSSLRKFIELSSEQRDAAVGTLTLEQFMPDELPADAEVEAFYAENEISFQSPDSASIEYLELSPTTVAESLVVTDEALALWFENNRDSFETPPERNPRHILIPLDDDEAAAEQLATDVYQRAIEGEDFATLAAEFSKDGGSAQVGGDLGWVRPGQFVGAVDDAVFAMEEGDIRGPVKSEFGFHVIRLDGIRAGGLPDLADVRAEVERDYRAAEADTRFEAQRDELADALFDNPDIAALAEAQNLTVQAIEEFTRSSAAVFLNDDTVLETVFGDNAIRGDALSDVISLSDGRTLVLRVTDYRPATTRALDDVRDDIVAELQRQSASTALAAAADTLAVGEYVDDAAFEQAVTAAGGTFAPSQAFSRSSAEPSPILVGNLFGVNSATDMPTLGHVETGEAAYIYRLTAITPGDPSALTDAERQRLRQQLLARSGSADLRAMVNRLSEKASIKLGGAQINNSSDF